MPIVSALNPKGGSGKTTISTNLARSLHERGQSVLMVDSDPQGSARDWHAANEANPVELVALDRPNNVKTLLTRLCCTNRVKSVPPFTPDGFSLRAG